jgi:tetratricopeptide (TPR) repeat protein
LELAEWYEAIACEDEALTLLSLAADYPIANYKKAWLLHKKGNETESIAVLNRANAISPESVFPFRPSTLKALEWAKTVRPDWKISYYEGLIYWANQDREKALALFNDCGETGFAPFYLSRASLKNGEECLADLLKAEKNEMSWRTGFALITYYVENNEWKQAVETGRKYLKKYPSNYYIGLKYAKALCETGQYRSCISLLDKMQVLPNEGSYAGRAVYRAANLYQAMEQLNRRNFRQVINSLEASKKWPENLGVGKPYDDMIDSRLEDYLEAKVAEGQGDKQKAFALLTSVAGYESSHSDFGSGNILSALALKGLGRTSEADGIVASWKTDFPDNRVAQWCTAIYEGKYEKAACMLNSRNDQMESTPWEASFHDPDFDLIVHCFKTYK